MAVAPRCFAHWPTIRPTPPAAAWNRIVSPGLHGVGLAQQILRGHALEHHGGGVSAEMSSGSGTSFSAGMTRISA